MKGVQGNQVLTGFYGSAIIKQDYDGAKEGGFLQGAFSSGFIGLTSEGSYSYRKFEDLSKWEKQHVFNAQNALQGCDVIEPNDVISGIFEEVSYIDTMADLEIVDVSHPGVEVIKVNSFDMYEVLSQFCDELDGDLEVCVETKYKTVAKKV